MGRRIFKLNDINTGNSELGFPVFQTNIFLRISKAMSGSPTSNKNFGLSGKRNMESPIIKLGRADIATNKFQLLKWPILISNGMTIHAITVRVFLDLLFPFEIYFNRYYMAIQEVQLSKRVPSTRELFLDI